jgi:hypothetical protein
VPTQEEKAELRTIAYGSSDPAVQVNAIVGLCNAFGPADDDANDMITMCEIAFGSRSPSKITAIEGYLHGMIGSILSLQHGLLDLQVWASDEADKAIGMQLTPADQRQRNRDRLAELKRRYKDAFSSAFEATKRDNNVAGYAGVLLQLGKRGGTKGHVHAWARRNRGCDA